MHQGGLDPWQSAVIGFCVESGCRFRKAMKFPDEVVAGLRVAKIGRSSVRYEIGLFRGDELESAADGYFVHVFVERQSETPVPVPDMIRDALSGLLISSD
jgi:acyl-CoA thioester hydrolase